MAVWQRWSALGRCACLVGAKWLGRLALLAVREEGGCVQPPRVLVPRSLLGSAWHLPCADEVGCVLFAKLSGIQ